MSDNVFYHCKVLNKDFTRDEWWEYLKSKEKQGIESSREVVYSEQGFDFNINDVCLNKKTDEVWHEGKNKNFTFYRLETWILFGEWHCSNTYDNTQKDNYSGGGTGDYVAKKEDDAKIQALEGMLKYMGNGMKDSCKKAIQQRINKLKFEQRQLSLW